MLTHLGRVVAVTLLAVVLSVPAAATASPTVSSTAGVSYPAPAQAAVTSLTAAVPAAASGCEQVQAGYDENGDVIYETVCPGAEVEGPGDTGGGDGGAGSPPSCDLDSVRGAARVLFCVGTTACAVNNPSSLPEDQWPMEERETPEHIYTFLFCVTADGEADYGWSWYLPEETGPSLRELAQQAFGALRAPTFDVAFNPPGRAYVGIPTWFWADTAQAGAVRGSSALGVVAIGEPSHLEVDPGDGGAVLRCGWTTTESDACAHTYQRSSAGAAASSGSEAAYTARIRLVYDVRFEDDGAPLSLPGLPTSLESPWQSGTVPVAEIQTLVDGT